MKQELRQANKKLLKKIQRQVLSQKVFKSEKARRNLIESPLEIITRHKIKWIKGIGVPKTPPKIRTEIVTFFQRLEILKQQKKNHDHILEILEQEIPKIVVYELLKIMFYLVHEAMYKPEWDAVSDDDEVDAAADEIPNEATIVYDSTIVCE